MLSWHFWHKPEMVNSRRDNSSRNFVASPPQPIGGGMHLSARMLSRLSTPLRALIACSTSLDLLVGSAIVIHSSKRVNRSLLTIYTPEHISLPNHGCLSSYILVEESIIARYFEGVPVLYTLPTISPSVCSTLTCYDSLPSCYRVTFPSIRVTFRFNIGSSPSTRFLARLAMPKLTRKWTAGANRAHIRM